MILLAIVVVVGLLVSMVARLVILAKGADTGTANLVFIIVMGICMIFYLTVMAAFSSVADFVADKIFPKIAGKKSAHRRIGNYRTCRQYFRERHRAYQTGSEQTVY